MGYLILGDIKNSRQYKVLPLWKKLNEVTTLINKKYKTKLKAPMMITLGDEFQLVTKNKEFAKEIIDYLKNSLNPYEIRLVVNRFYLDTSKFNTLKKFNKCMNKSPINPLISKAFLRTHIELDKKESDFISLFGKW